MAGASDDDRASATTVAAGDDHATGPARGPTAAIGPVRNQTWARYVVLEPLGTGGMGSVWVAFDPELERKVALKVLHDELLGRANQEQLRREAKAMARIAHPNVVPVFDVGEHAGRIYYTMELVKGRSLRDWGRTPRPWREVQRLFVDAARGLAAIHAAGLVHRDIKPGNLLVGDDGRARVVDLGIAITDAEPAASADATPLVATTNVHRAGTPGYMAPEQLDGAAGNALSDQFSFGVALWELLFGVRPFPSDDAARRRAEMDGAPARTGARAVPDWLVEVARRVLAVDPAARFPDAAALARALEGPRRRRWPIAVAAAVAIAAVIVTIGAVTRGTATVDPCARAGRELDAWTPAASAALATRAVRRDPRDPQPASVIGALDAEVAGWRIVARDACRRGESRSWSTELDARATSCLAERRRDVELAGASTDLRVLARRVTAIASPSRCLDAGYLAARVQPPAELGRAALVDATRMLLDIAEGDLERSRAIPTENGYRRPDDARARIDSARRMLDTAGPFVDRLGYAPLSFRAASLRASYLRDHLLYDGTGDEIRHQGQTAYAIARAANDDDDAERGLVAVLEDALSYRGNDTDHWLAVAHADVARQPDVDAAPLLLVTVAAIELDRGRLPEAIADAQRALDLAVRTYGEASPVAGDALALYGKALVAADRPREALPFLERELVEVTAWFGKNSVAITNDQCALASAYGAVGRHAKAIEVAQRAVDTFRGLPVVAGRIASVDEGRALACLGAALSAAGRDVAAIEPLERGSKLLMIHSMDGVSPREALAAEVAYYRGWVRGERGADRAKKIAGILPWERGVIERTGFAVGADDSDTLSAATAYAEALAQLGKCPEAIAIAQPAADKQEHGGHRARAVEALVVVARCRIDARDLDGALSVIRHAESISGDIDPALRAIVAHHHAVAALASGAVEEARAYELERRTALVAADGDAETTSKIDGWIATPKGPPP